MQILIAVIGIGATSHHFHKGQLHHVPAHEILIVHSPPSEEGQKNKNEFPQNNLPFTSFIIIQAYEYEENVNSLNLVLESTQRFYPSDRDIKNRNNRQTEGFSTQIDKILLCALKKPPEPINKTNKSNESLRQVRILFFYCLHKTKKHREAFGLAVFFCFNLF